MEDFRVRAGMPENRIIGKDDPLYQRILQDFETLDNLKQQIKDAQGDPKAIDDHMLQQWHEEFNQVQQNIAQFPLVSQAVMKDRFLVHQVQQSTSSEPIEAPVEPFRWRATLNADDGGDGDEKAVERDDQTYKPWVDEPFDNTNLIPRMNEDPQTQGFEVKQPTNFQTLTEMMEEAVRNGKRIRAMGTQYGFSKVAYTNGYLIDMSELNNTSLELADLREDADAAHLVHVESGATVKSVNDVLWPLNMRAKTEDEDTRQKFRMIRNATGYHDLSIGGLVSVGAQGSGIDNPGLASQVMSVRLITVQGDDLVTYQIEGEGDRAIHDPATFSTNENVNKNVKLVQNNDAFNAVVGSVGCTGIIYSVVLKVVDAFFMQEDRYMTTWEEFMSGDENKEKTYAHLLKRSQDPDFDSFEVWVSPYLMFGHHDICVTEYTFVEGPPTRPITWQTRGSAAYSLKLVQLSADSAALASKMTPFAIPSILSSALQTAAYHPPLTMDAISAQNFGAPNGVTVTAGGWGVSLDQLKVVGDGLIKVLDDLFKKEGSLGFWTGPVITSPFSFRFADSGHGFLTMQFNRQNIFIEQPLHVDTHGKDDILAAERNYLLSDEVRGRQHLAFAQQFEEQDAYDVWDRSYEQIERFVEHYKYLNSSGLFCNPWTELSGIDRKVREHGDLRPEIAQIYA